MNKQKIKRMIKFNVNKSIQNKWFTILNVVLMLIMIVTLNITNITDFLENNNINLFNTETKIEVVDNENLGFEKIKEGFSEDEVVDVEKIEENNYTADTIADETIVLELEKDEENIINIKMISKESIDTYLYDEIYEILSEIRVELFAEQNEIELEELEIMNEELNIDRIMLGVNNENAEKKQIINMITTFAIYMISIFVFSSISNEIAQEKVSKSIEYVLTSVTAKEYLFVKVVSTILVIFLQAIYMVLYYLIGSSINIIINASQLDLTVSESVVESFKAIDTEIILYIITVFSYALLTLILMSIIQAAISSKTTSMSEAQNAVMLLTMITIFAYFVTLAVITPETNMNLFMYGLACMPLLSNYMVPAILMIGQATPALILVSLILLLLSIPVSFAICAKVFKEGVLNYNSKQTKVKRKAEMTLKEEQEMKFKKAKYKKFSFAIGLAIIMYIVIENLGATLFGTLLVPFIKDFFTEAQLEILISLIVSIVSLLIAIAVINVYKDGNTKVEKHKLKSYQKIEIIAIGIFALVAIQFLTSFIISALGIDYSVNTILFSNEENDLLTNILTILLVVVQAGIFEELLFRKTIIDYSKNNGKIFSIILSSLVFGLIHMNISQMIFAFLIGIVFGTIYALTGNISLSIILHLLNNGYATLINLLKENTLAIQVIDISILIIAFFGLLSLIRLLNKNKETIKSNIKALKKNKKNLSEYKYMFLDFTFVASMIAIIVMSLITEKILSIM